MLKRTFLVPIALLITLAGCQPGTIQYPILGGFTSSDPLQDVYDDAQGGGATDQYPKGDIIAAASYYKPTQLTLAVKTDAVNKPDDDSSATVTVKWFIETTDDSEYDFLATTCVGPTCDSTFSVIDRISGKQTCTGAASFTAAIYVYIDPTSCFGGPGLLRYEIRVTYVDEGVNTHDDHIAQFEDANANSYSASWIKANPDL